MRACQVSKPPALSMSRRAPHGRSSAHSPRIISIASAERVLPVDFNDEGASRNSPTEVTRLGAGKGKGKGGKLHGKDEVQQRTPRHARAVGRLEREREQKTQMLVDDMAEARADFSIAPLENSGQVTGTAPSGAGSRDIDEYLSKWPGSMSPAESSPPETPRLEVAGGVSAGSLGASMWRDMIARERTTQTVSTGVATGASDSDANSSRVKPVWKRSEALNGRNNVELDWMPSGAGGSGRGGGARGVPSNWLAVAKPRAGTSSLLEEEFVSQGGGRFRVHTPASPQASEGPSRSSGGRSSE